ncbi:hypothetical protein A3J43_02945 [Candidatus Uhrbacteria bacterium RIFCSPHIGHO2_12_FULL_54_23]|uniref:PIN domain-containing protein n=3 Tax=Candidatus Uhriibacteriota TaxID=1752732 RepID=A0A1F7VG66_9BACT|nr:MAG: hypothetical protein A3J43_02935 [Candidatus Uhrbacteria bacterium RIFCSPHIGHO2_12_FULL_54_23]OGL77894.1 MAG: hypothetical protein A3J43_02945 [Candidatus Uhrbacteria bacterium RIFCSPHIGHO2_12_FULL_54_23]OGL85542.1 MAG: hypothetical protein A3B36_00585 [Candidatus Uhrbacteria bacterium RIFCSPLOWO2_01_FULL_55_36]OGL89512.1 MAG: hypothetical protein A3J36_03540 [Candidatus Uhrbacteria bacterium RIFCSPLOWO2_02_FULL_54_37]OGL89514.1 MAG: hypothetical protein A3J36_03550 [Candidatus Uhrbacte
MPNTSPEKKRILIDSSVIIAGLLSPSGGSAKVLNACREGGVFCYLSPAIRNEVVRNLPANQPSLKEQFERYASSCQTAEVKDEELNEFVGIVDEKDIHVIIAARNAGADVIVSLNRKHLLDNMRIRNVIHVRIITPKTLIREIAL